jgi:hypothetical protein
VVYGPPDYPRPPEYPRAVNSPTVILLVSGLTAVLGFLIGMFTGMGSQSTPAEPAPRITVTVEDSSPPAEPTQDASVPPPDATAPAPTGPAPTGPAPTGPAPTGPAPTGSAPAGPAPTGSGPAGTAPAASTSLPSAAMRTLVVGVDIQPGPYRTAGPATASDVCYWARMKSASGRLADVITAGMPTGPATVTILATDKAFQTGGCAEWARA